MLGCNKNYFTICHLFNFFVAVFLCVHDPSLEGWTYGSKREEKTTYCVSPPLFPFNQTVQQASLVFVWQGRAIYSIFMILLISFGFGGCYLACPPLLFFVFLCVFGAF
ncbi:MAG: hypothetical protein JOS17DRAFT_745117 [Linnemannia elongata]|nr:MAG: hypothetical protein JOS17DRAFT_745117 [Linnemannia elongata]